MLPSVYGAVMESVSAVQAPLPPKNTFVGAPELPLAVKDWDGHVSEEPPVVPDTCTEGPTPSGVAAFTYADTGINVPQAQER